MGQGGRNSVISRKCEMFLVGRNSYLYVWYVFFFLMITPPTRSTTSRSSDTSDVDKRQKPESNQISASTPKKNRISLLQAHAKKHSPPCLFNTSPSPRNRTRSRIPSSAWKKKKNRAIYNQPNKISILNTSEPTNPYQITYALPTLNTNTLYTNN